MELSQYIQELKAERDGLEEKALKLLKERENYIVGAVKLRLFEYGINGDGTPQYTSLSTIRKKRKKGQRSSHVTLNWTGEFWNNYFIKFEGTELKLFNDDGNKPKVDRLVSMYGKSIFEFGDHEAKIVQEILKELEDGIVRKFNSTDIK